MKIFSLSLLCCFLLGSPFFYSATLQRFSPPLDSDRIESKLHSQQFLNTLYARKMPFFLPYAECSSKQKDRFYVYKVVDGDTFWMRGSRGEEVKVRLIGIDAPETRNSQYKKKGYYAQESKAYLQRMIGNKWIKIVLDVQHKDRYGRLLAYVFTLDGTFVNGALIKGGYAVTATFPPNVRYARQFVAWERVARKEKKGMFK